MRLFRSIPNLMVVGILLSVSLVGNLAQAGVNLKNGNYYVSYSDIRVPGGGEPLEITRTYNSKSTKKGWFGFGWGSDFETFLEVSADGSVVVHENGSGAQTRFVPRGAIDHKGAVKKIISEMRKKNRLNSENAKALTKKLEKDAELRQMYARRYKIKSKLSTNTVLYSNNRGKQKMKVTKKGFVRAYGDGKKETFNKDGKLLSVVKPGGYKIQFIYKKGNLFSIKDSAAKQVYFSWYPNGHIKELWSAGDKKAKYKYEGSNLVESKDVAGNTYKFSYDKNHNLLKITYSDKSTYEVKYEPKTFFVSQVKDRKGKTTAYKYESNPKNKFGHYWTLVTKKNSAGKPITNRYEYEIKTKADGETYTYRILTVINGLKTETIYSECCSLPITIKRGKHVTNFEYKDGLLTKKTSSSGENVKIQYDKKWKKIKRVDNRRGWTEFAYDKKGQLKTAKNKKGSVRLVYDIKGRIKIMSERRHKKKRPRVLKFTYNSLGKPVKIEMDGVGKINVVYDNYGQIKKVESKAGHKMALQVTQAFQSLLAMVKPAGVNLSL